MTGTDPNCTDCQECTVNCLKFKICNYTDSSLNLGVGDVGIKFTITVVENNDPVVYTAVIKDIQEIPSNQCLEIIVEIYGDGAPKIISGIDGHFDSNFHSTNKYLQELCDASKIQFSVIFGSCARGGEFFSQSDEISFCYSDCSFEDDDDDDDDEYYSYKVEHLTFKCKPPCFTENTLVLTDKGYVNVQDLKNNDIVVTHDGRHVPIKSVMRLPTVSSQDTDPFLYKAHCFSENYPPIDTYLSPHHSILINDKWDVKGRSDRDLWTHGAHLKYNNFLNENIQQVKIADKFNYYHIYLPDFKTDHLVINHGLVVEGFGIDYHITHRRFQEDPRVFIVDLEKKVLDI